MRTFSKCYEVSRLQPARVAYDHRMLIDALPLLAQVADFPSIEPYLDEYNHGIVGAIEFLRYVNEDVREEYAQAIQTIAFHDEEIDRRIVFSQAPVLAVLVLCDAMQD